MAANQKSKRVSMGHVFFIDIMGYSSAHPQNESTRLEVRVMVRDTGRALGPPKPRSYSVYQLATVARLSFAIWKRLYFAPSKLPKHCGTIRIFASAWAFTVGRLMKSPT